MTIVEAMKMKKRLTIKAEDLRKKIALNSATREGATQYENQTEMVAKWLQSHRDIVSLIEKLSVAIQRTNLQTPVTVVLSGKEITKSLAEWVFRRREGAGMELAAYQGLTDHGLQEAAMKDGQTGEIKVLKVIRFYDPKARDEATSLYASEPSRIDAKLEVVNATTALVDDIKVEEDKL